MKLYEYAVILDEVRDRDDQLVAAGRIIVQPVAVLARDDAQAQLLAARAIPDEYLDIDQIDRVMVVVRPF